MTQFAYRDVEGTSWVCLRPNRVLSVFEYDLRKRGFELVPAVLFDREPAQCMRDENGWLWHADFVDAYELYSRTIYDLPWLLDRMSARREAFERCKGHTKDLVTALRSGEGPADLTECRDQLLLWRTLLTQAIPFLLMAMITDDLLGESLERHVARTSNSELAIRLRFDLARSEYARNAIADGIVPTKDKAVRFPPEALFVPRGSIRFDLRSDAEADYIEHLSQRCGSALAHLDQFNRLKVAAPLVFQMSEENFYVTRGLTIAMNWVLDSLGSELVERGMMSSQRAILDYTVDQVAQLCTEAGASSR